MNLCAICDKPISNHAITCEECNLDENLSMGRHFSYDNLDEEYLNEDEE